MLGKSAVHKCEIRVDQITDAEIFLNKFSKEQFRLFRNRKGVRSADAKTPKRDRKARDLAAAKAALGANLRLPAKPIGRRRASDDLLRGGPVEPKDTVTDDGDDEGTDAGKRPSDTFSLIAGADRHEQRKT